MSYDIDAAKTWTNDRRTSWIVREVPHGSKVAIETRGTAPAGRLSRRLRQAIAIRATRGYAAAGTDYLIASSQIYGLYLANPQSYPDEYGDYVRLFREAREVARFAPTKDHPGPELRVLKVVP